MVDNVIRRIDATNAGPSLAGWRVGIPDAVLTGVHSAADAFEIFARSAA